MDNKQTILQCALDLFYARGYDAVGVQEIVDRAGISKPTLYHYFGSKQGLLKNLLETGFAYMESRIRLVIGLRENLPHTLYLVAREFFDCATANRKYYLFMLGLFYSARENEAYLAVSPLIQRYYHMIVSIFENASAELGNMNGRQQQFAVGFTGILNHHIMMVSYGAEDQEIIITDEITYAIVHQFMHGIYS